MRQAPTDLDVGRLATLLQQRWDFRAVRLEYVAVGGGSHHWRAEDARGEHLWLSVDDLDDKVFLGRTRAECFAALRTALQTAQQLHEVVRLQFVVAPLAGGPIRVTDRYALAVYPFVDGVSYRFGEQLPDVEQERLLGLLVRLHGATPVVAGMANRAAVDVGERAALEAALSDAAGPWSGGPFAEEARSLVAAHVLDFRELLGSFDRLAGSVGGPHVIAHGEPHPANLLITPGGAMLLLDWDTVGLAPPERDLWWLDAAYLAEYTRETGRAVDPNALRLYRMRWFLDDLAYCLKRLRSADTPRIDAERAWGWLEGVADERQAYCG